MNNLYTRVTAQLIDSLEAGVAPWVRPWSTVAEPIPRNGVSRRPYRGINVLLLSLKAFTAGYADNRWLTYRQAQALGGQVKRGETGTTVVFYERRTFAESDDTSHVRVVPFVKTFVVFNTAQVDNLPQAQADSAPAWEASASAASLVEQSGARVVHGGNVACYQPREDLIRIPAQGQFRDAGSYYATLLHELAHWTGHPARCARELGKRFGDNAYAMEELIAEIGAAFLCAHCRIDGALQHASYLDHWLRVLRKTPQALLTAAAKAQQLTDFLTAHSEAAEQHAA